MVSCHVRGSSFNLEGSEAEGVDGMSDAVRRAVLHRDADDENVTLKSVTSCRGSE